MNAQIRGLEDRDRDALHRFLTDVPADDRTFFKEDVSGELQDLVVLAHGVDETWAGMLSAGLDRALT